MVTFVSYASNLVAGDTNGVSDIFVYDREAGAPSYTPVKVIFDGGAGNDTLGGGAGSDSLIGAGGIDSLAGAAGADSLKGGSGKDTLDGGAGIDRADYSDGAAAVSVTLAASSFANVSVGGAAEDRIRNIEDVIGGAGNDKLTGDRLANGLIGGAGNDSLAGAQGADALIGGAGRDTLGGGAGSDALDGGTGLDTADYSDKTTAISVTLKGTGLASVSVGGTVEDRVKNIENLTGGAGNDSLGGDGLANRLAGAAGSDTLSGGAGIDSLASGLGNDSLKGGIADDTLDGGAGTDTASYSDKPAALSVKLAGATLVHVYAGGMIEDHIRNVENVLGGAASDTLEGDSRANGFAGGLGHDSLSGGAGKDDLSGGAGNDTLAGGLGADLLNGAAGADRFDFDAIAETPINASRDTVSDFSHAEGDRIDLSTIDAKTTVAGNQAFSFVGTGAFTHHAGELRLIVQGANGIVAGDVDGDGAADFHIFLSGVSSLMAGDFLL
jgi:Ca2+-binding RTX toxin-like protein